MHLLVKLLKRAVPFLNESDMGRQLQNHHIEKWNPSSCF